MPARLHACKKGSNSMMVRHTCCPAGPARSSTLLPYPRLSFAVHLLLCSDLSNRNIAGTLAVGLRKAAKLEVINLESNK